MGDLLAAADEIGAIWNDAESEWPHPPGVGLYPGPEWFDELGRSHIASIAIELESRLKDEHWWVNTGPRERPRYAPRRFHLLAQGIACGIKIGLAIAERRAAQTKEMVTHDRRADQAVHRDRPR